jgi:dihydrofolate reductase
MRKLILKISVSIDGFVGGPNGEIDWIFKSMDEEATAWAVNTIWQAGLHIMGRRTFHDMASYWPTSTEPFAPPMNEIPKAVFTRKGVIEPASAALTTTAFKDASRLSAEERAKHPGYVSPYAHTWAEAIVTGDDLVRDINLLKQQPGKEIMAHGGAGFAQSLVKAGVIDEYRLLVHPVALGKGLPLFSTLAQPLDLKLQKVIPFGGGAAAHIYQPV